MTKEMTHKEAIEDIFRFFYNQDVFLVEPDFVGFYEMPSEKTLKQLQNKLETLQEVKDRIVKNATLSSGARVALPPSFILPTEKVFVTSETVENLLEQAFDTNLALRCTHSEKSAYSSRRAKNIDDLDNIIFSKIRDYEELKLTEKASAMKSKYHEIRQVLAEKARHGITVRKASGSGRKFNIRFENEEKSIQYTKATFVMCAVVPNFQYTESLKREKKKILESIAYLDEFDLEFLV